MLKLVVQQGRSEAKRRGVRFGQRSRVSHEAKDATRTKLADIFSILLKEPLAAKKNDLGIPACDTPKPMLPSP